MGFLILSILLSILSVFERIFLKVFFAANVLNDISGATSIAALIFAIFAAAYVLWNKLAYKKTETQIPRWRALSYLGVGLLASSYSLFHLLSILKK